MKPTKRSGRLPAKAPLLLLLFLALHASLSSRGGNVPTGGLSVTAGDTTFLFGGRCVILYSPTDPKPAMKNFIGTYRYFSVSWLAGPDIPKKKLIPASKRTVVEMDGIDARMEAGRERRTFDVFHSGEPYYLTPTGFSRRGNRTVYEYRSGPLFDFRAEAVQDGNETLFTFTLTPHKSGYYSVGYLGAPSVSPAATDEVWQPMVWQQKAFPEQPFLSQAFQCPLPMSMISFGGYTIGVMVPPSEFPFDPLPTQYNNRFGVAVHNERGEAQPMVFAPVPGGPGSKMEPGNTYRFSVSLKASRGGCREMFRTVARNDYGFTDYRSNATGPLNRTIDNMIAYATGPYSRFIDSLRGFSYSTDVPGSVKNVTMLNALDIAQVTDNEQMFFRRAKPIVEFMLSRGNSLFNLDTAVKVQNPGRSMEGPCATPTELAALNRLNGGVTPYLADFMQQRLSRKGDTEQERIDRTPWHVAMVLYKATGDRRYLERAVEDADRYIEKEIDQRGNLLRGAFFWNKFAPLFMPLYEMYEITGDRKYLEASRQAANYYAMFVWMSPRIPEGKVTVNRGGDVPIYWYLKSKGHRPMHMPEEEVEAWRVSEIGLLPESSTTSIGHRAVFMAHHAPFFMKIAAETGDTFLRDIARSAVVGRYRNFPGYHMNTERTTVYEQADYPLRDHLDLSYNSFHYNHILPMISMLIDYLVSDAADRSRGAIRFPSYYNEGYAYLANNFYGPGKGEFHGYGNVTLWMPGSLLATSSPEVNYLTGYDDSNLFIALTNQSAAPVTTTVTLNPGALPGSAGRTLRAEMWKDNRKTGETEIRNGKFETDLSPKGITALIVKGIGVKPAFRNRMFAGDGKPWRHAHTELGPGNASAMILDLGEELRSAFVFLRDDERKATRAWIEYIDASGNRQRLEDHSYPYEFSVALPAGTEKFSFDLHVVTPEGKTESARQVTLFK